MRKEWLVNYSWDITRMVTHFTLQTRDHLGFEAFRASQIQLSLLNAHLVSISYCLTQNMACIRTPTKKAS
jgi:hypothetical protein